MSKSPNGKESHKRLLGRPAKQNRLFLGPFLTSGLKKSNENMSASEAADGEASKQTSLAGVNVYAFLCRVWSTLVTGMNATCAVLVGLSVTSAVCQSCEICERRGNGTSLLVFNLPPVGKQPFTTYQPPPGQDGLGSETKDPKEKKKTPICGCERNPRPPGWKHKDYCSELERRRARLCCCISSANECRPFSEIFLRDIVPRCKLWVSDYINTVRPKDPEDGQKFSLL